MIHKHTSCSLWQILSSSSFRFPEIQDIYMYMYVYCTNRCYFNTWRSKSKKRLYLHGSDLIPYVVERTASTSCADSSPFIDFTNIFIWIKQCSSVYSSLTKRTTIANASPNRDVPSIKADWNIRSTYIVSLLFIRVSSSFVMNVNNVQFKHILTIGYPVGIFF